MIEQQILLGDSHRYVIHREPPLSEEILSHVSQSCGRIDGVTPHSIPLQIWCRITALNMDLLLRAVIDDNNTDKPKFDA
jgi:hypothetical protein